jgi:ankyrin repeat protein
MNWYVEEDSVTPEEATNQLFRAARSGNAEDAQAALAAGADVNARDDWQRTPLHCAIEARHGDLSRLLIERGTDLRAQDHQQQTALHWAARNGLSDLARLLLERGANPAAQDKWRYTPFDWASLSGHTELARFLLDAARSRTGHADRILQRRDRDPDLSRG